MQEHVEARYRGTLNGVQTSLYQFFFVLIQIGGMVFHNPKDFEVRSHLRVGWGRLRVG